MKKFAALLLIFVFILSVSACSSSTEVKHGSYIFTPSDDSFGTGAGIYLQDGNKASISFAIFSSYIGFGAYKIDGDTLTLNTDDGKYHYTFDIVEDGLKFDAEKSSDMTWGSTFTDGDIFVYTDTEE